MDSSYKYEIGQCDLPEASHSSLQSFREKRSVWLSWIDKDEHHAISQVLSSMAWADVSFRTLQTIATTDESSSLHNALLSEMLHQGYFASQLLAIRRLADNRKKGAISIKRLLKDMAGNIYLPWYWLKVRLK